MLTATLATLLLGLAPAAAAATVHELQWVVPTSGSFPDVTINVGEMVKFISSSAHDLVQVDAKNFEACKEDGGQMWSTKSVFNTATPLPYFALMPSVAGTYYFICSIGGHCEAGQKVKVIVAEAESAAAALESPPAESPSASDAAAADSASTDVAQATLTVHLGGQVNVGAGGLLVLGGEQD